MKEYAISGRVKETHSFLRKALKKQYANPLEDMHDKMGVRVELLYAEDVTAVCDRIRAEHAAFTVVKEDVKRHSPNQLGYLGTHFDVLPYNRPATISESIGVCEVQVRTLAQGAWAMASHDLLYKIPVVVPEVVERRINRLMALLELFDEEVTRARMAVLAQPEYPAARVIDALEGNLVRFATPAVDVELTQQIVELLISEMPPEEVQLLPERIKSWIAENADKLSEIYDRYREDTRHLLLLQPEALLVFHELDTGGRFRLQEVWERRLPISLLEDLATVWGQPL